MEQKKHGQIHNNDDDDDDDDIDDDDTRNLLNGAKTTCPKQSS
jgi:hypothetical protein